MDWGHPCIWSSGIAWFLAFFYLKLWKIFPLMVGGGVNRALVYSTFFSFAYGLKDHFLLHLKRLNWFSLYFCFRWKSGLGVYHCLFIWFLILCTLAVIVWVPFWKVNKQVFLSKNCFRFRKHWKSNYWDCWSIWKRHNRELSFDKWLFAFSF